jgi:hypothetical protein
MGVPVGGEFPVNTFTAGDQAAPAVGMDANGDFVVVWASAHDGSGRGIFGQRYDGTGLPVGSEFPVNTYTLGDQNAPDVAMDANGNFVVVWESFGQDGSSRGVFGQRYDKSGAPMGTEFPVNTYTALGQDHAAVASDAQGNFVAVWESRDQDGNLNGIFGQRFDAAGNFIGSEFPVNTNTSGPQQDPDVARNAEGEFVVVWESLSQDGDGWGVFGQRFDAVGNPVGSEFGVNTTIAGNQEDAGVALDANGNFVVTWESHLSFPDKNVIGQQYDAAGNPLGPEFQVNEFLAYFQDDPAAAIAMNPIGDFVVVWESAGQEGIGGNDGIFGRRFLGAPGIGKIITAGPDEDFDQNTDVVVLVKKTSPTVYEFEIVYTNPGGPSVVITDAVPAEWQVLVVAGHFLADGFSAGEVWDGAGGTVAVFPANKKTNNKSATRIVWVPDPGNDRSTISVVVKSRPRPSKKEAKFAPTSCGALFLNDGAFVFELGPDGTALFPEIFSSKPLLLVAVKDLGGDGIVGDGSGDEDGDGRMDLQEVREAPFTDPCNPDSDGDTIPDGDEVAQGTDPNKADTDGDGVPDGMDLCPLDNGGGLINGEGCPIYP